MQLNADFSQRVVIRPDDYCWVPSPANGVERMMLDRIGDEVARATSLVRYKPGSSFPTHIHGGGEEFLVLEGEFADEHGRYPAGTYVRNPIGSSHAPSIGSAGAQIFVKLCQFNREDRATVVRDTRRTEWVSGRTPGVAVMPLHQHGAERVALMRWAPNTRIDMHCHWGGEETFVIKGTFYDEQGVYPQGTWLREPHLSQHQPYTLEEGAMLFVKTGHLPR